MHSRYLTYVFELGVFGLLSFLGLLFSVLYWARRAIAVGGASRALVLNLIGFTFAFFTLSMGLIGGSVYSPWYFFWAYTGIAMRGAAVLILTSPQGSSRLSSKSNSEGDSECTPPSLRQAEV